LKSIEKVSWNEEYSYTTVAVYLMYAIIGYSTLEYAWFPPADGCIAV